MQIHHGHIFSLVLACFFTIDCFAEEPGVCINTDEAELLQLVDDYRVENELPTVAWSQSLMTVGQWHAVDAATNGDTIFENPCNLHSWSDDHPELWTGMCYTPDHAQREWMWSKPEEISGGVYTAAGFENAAWGQSSVAAALDAWKNSPGHNDVILNNGVWSEYPWLAMGVGVDLEKKYYYLWFSTMSDPLGDMPLCSTNSAPTQPGTLSASAITENSATVSWDASTDADDDPITYLVEYRRNGDVPWTSGGNTNSTSQALSGLDPSQSYDVQVTPNDSTDDGTARTTLNLFETLNDDLVFTDSFE